MNEPDATASDRELAEYYEQEHDRDQWDEPAPVAKPERLDVTISVRFTAGEIATIRSRAEAAGLKPTAYIRQCALEAEQPPVDRSRLVRTVAALARDVDDLRRLAG